MNITDKKVMMELPGAGANAFDILGKFRQKAESQGWTRGEIHKVVMQATSGDQINLIETVKRYIRSAS